jgi:hypothetical protein
VSFTVHGFTGFFIPHQCYFALVGDADADNLVRADIGLGQDFHQRRALLRSDFHRIVFI